MDNFSSIYKIFEDSFPANERRDFSGQKALLDNPYYQLKTHIQDGEIIAFMGVWTFDDFTFLEHFATTPKARGKGIGSKMFTDLLWESKLLILEVEPPENEIAQRRINFYSKNSMYLNYYEYNQPPLNFGDSFLPLKIMSSGKELTQNEFTRVRDTLYKYVYNTRL